ncbi:MAG: DNA repair protein RadA [Candidatus Omnitrophota bacterium]
MTTTKTIFICQECGCQSPKWLGRCPDCQKWNSLMEEMAQGAVSESITRRSYSSNMPPQRLKDVKQNDCIRTKTNINELDRVLGGGIVAGSVILIGGEPGIGKSTLLLEVSNILAKEKRVLYVSGEESITQTKMRSERLGISSDNLYVINDIEVSSIAEHIESLNPDIVVIDSIQVLYNKDFSQTAGSVTQIKESAGALTALAKYKGFSLFIVGHVTKEGSIAGPKILEHMVDCVIYFESANLTAFRILKSTKNRFGPTNEIGVFHMTQKGLIEVENPSEVFLSARGENISGSTVVSTIEGTRPILVEIQALVTASNFSMSRQRAIGYDLNRLLLLIAVLEKRLGLNLVNHDVFVNVAGGIKIAEPACDLAVTVAIASSFKNKPVDNETIFIGEIGLGGEIRGVGQIELRVNEASRLGFKRCILPKQDMTHIKAHKQIKLLGVKNIQEAADISF